jgi:hypothetical protein
LTQIKALFVVIGELFIQQGMNRHAAAHALA